MRVLSVAIILPIAAIWYLVAVDQMGQEPVGDFYKEMCANQNGTWIAHTEEGGPACVDTDIDKKVEELVDEGKDAVEGAIDSF
jgi:hypothetical protein